MADSDKAFSEGRAAGQRGAKQDENPYDYGTDEWAAWHAGWVDGFSDR